MAVGPTLLVAQATVMSTQQSNAIAAEKRYHLTGGLNMICSSKISIGLSTKAKISSKLQAQSS
jgi:hypothetical protein